ncbi:MAG: HAD-IIIA family hydrolase, partial [Nitrosarchaeum sp.]
ELKKIHEFMIEKLRKDGCIINQIYYCPHMPEENCDCRKPKTLLFKKALIEFSPYDLKNSWVIGDNISDMEAAYSLGIKGIKIDSNQDIQMEINEIISFQQ